MTLSDYTVRRMGFSEFSRRDHMPAHQAQGS
jgi:hypothetical protein